MKKVITALLVQSIISLHVFAQTPQTSISGSVVDDKKKSVEAATISLMKAADSTLFKISVTDKAGKFSFQNIPFGSYYINASAINHAKLNSNVFDLNSTSLTKDIDAIVPLLRRVSPKALCVGEDSAASGYKSRDY
jgi:iron complex outermembrane recepter protein